MDGDTGRIMSEKKIIKEGKYKGFEKLPESTKEKTILKLHNTTVTFTLKDDGKYSIETKTELGGERDWNMFWEL